MKDQLLSVAAYIESLEQRIAALEARCDGLENELKQRPAPFEDENEPEVEVELIVDEEEQDFEPEQEPEQVNEPEEETQPQEQEQDATDVSADLQTTGQESQPEPETIPEPAPENEPEPQPAPQPQAPVQPQPARAPQQTSLFGAPVSDIRQAISIGDRFLFQRELFGGNGEAMQKLLDRFNTCAGLGEAMDIVARQDWDKESPTYELFINVLRRRFQS